jgi:hypothetical protein
LQLLSYSQSLSAKKHDLKWIRQLLSKIMSFITLLLPIILLSFYFFKFKLTFHQIKMDGNSKQQALENANLIIFPLSNINE